MRRAMFASFHLLLFLGCAMTTDQAPATSPSTSPAGPQHEDCPVAGTPEPGEIENWHKGRASYSARQVGDQVHVMARGQHRTGGYQVMLAMQMVRIYPPRFTFYVNPPEEMATQAITPFRVCVRFTASEPVERVIVTDAAGDHEVPVRREPESRREP